MLTQHFSNRCINESRLKIKYIVKAGVIYHTLLYFKLNQRVVTPRNPRLDTVVIGQYLIRHYYYQSKEWEVPNKVV